MMHCFKISNLNTLNLVSKNINFKYRCDEETNFSPNHNETSFQDHTFRNKLQTLVQKVTYCTPYRSLRFHCAKPSPSQRDGKTKRGKFFYTESSGISSR